MWRRSLDEESEFTRSTWSSTNRASTAPRHPASRAERRASARRGRLASTPSTSPGEAFLSGRLAQATDDGSGPCRRQNPAHLHPHDDWKLGLHSLAPAA